jgi:uncharacterized protein (TIGR03118 family)
MLSPRILPFLSVSLLSLSASSLFAQNAYVQTDLVCDTTYYANQGFTTQTQPNLIVDPYLQDAWGISIRPPGAGGHFWITNAVTGRSDEFIGDVTGNPLHQDGLTSVPLDAPRFIDHSAPFVTGVVYNSASDTAGQPAEFVIGAAHATDALDYNTGGTDLGLQTGVAKFVFVTQDGCVNAWLANSAKAMISAPLIIDYSKTGNFPPSDDANAVFTGVAMTQNVYTTAAYQHNGIGGTGNLLFATDQRNNVINVFDNQWNDVTSQFEFQQPAEVDPTSTFTPPNGLQTMHVFNIIDINHHLFVTYAEFKPAGDEGQEQFNGVGLGHLVEYNEDGSLVMDFHDFPYDSVNGVLNEPWGVAIAPATFGAYANDVLVANFGDGSIAAFNPNTGNFVGYLQDQNGNQVNIDGIWGLVFGNGVSLGDANSLYFTAGPYSETSGLFGKLTVAAVPAFTSTGTVQFAENGTAYTSTFTASGNPTPTFTVTSGSLPPGLTLSSSGVLSGTATQAGTYTFTVTASNGYGASTTQTVTITIQNPADSPTLPPWGLALLAALLVPIAAWSLPQRRNA